MECSRRAAQKGNPVAAARLLYDFRISCLLKNNDVRRNGANHFSQFLSTFSSAEPDVVAEQLNNHEAFGASITV